MIDVRIFTRDGVEKDSRAQQIEEMELKRIRKDLNDQLRILEVRPLPAHGADAGRSSGRGRTQRPARRRDPTLEYLNALRREQWFHIRMQAEELNEQLEKIKSATGQEQRKDFDQKFEEKRRQLTQGDDRVATLKMVKVYLAGRASRPARRQMTGRHGNKGVVSMIVPQEDMPYLEDGTPVDIVLNPLGNLADERRPGAGNPSGLGRQGPGLEIGRLLDARGQLADLRSLLDQIDNQVGGQSVDLRQFSDAEPLALCRNLRGGVPIATPAFDGATEEEMRELLRLAELSEPVRAPCTMAAPAIRSTDR